MGPALLFSALLLPLEPPGPSPSAPPLHENGGWHRFRGLEGRENGGWHRVEGVEWTVEALREGVLAELAADGLELPSRALVIEGRQESGWHLEVRSDDGERRWRDLASLPEELEAAVASARVVVLELISALPRVGEP